MRKIVLPHLWITEFEDEIEADFLRFYRIFDVREEPDLDGPRFIRLATQLSRYQGAVRARLEFENATEESGGRPYRVPEREEEDSRFEPGQKMSMAEALARSRGDEKAVLDQLNREGKNSAFGALFEYETA